jgi:hypothetical protein
MTEQSRTEQGYSDQAIRLVNVDNGQTITQLTSADLRRLASIVAPDNLADKLRLFGAYLDGKNDVRGRRS